MGTDNSEMADGPFTYDDLPERYKVLGASVSEAAWNGLVDTAEVRRQLRVGQMKDILVGDRLIVLDHSWTGEDTPTARVSDLR
jgi:hypothetical protein